MSLTTNSITSSCQAFFTRAYQHPYILRVSRAAQVALRAMAQADCSKGLILGVGLITSSVLLNPVITSQRSLQVTDAIGLACISLAMGWLFNACDMATQTVHQQPVAINADGDRSAHFPTEATRNNQNSVLTPHPQHSPAFIAAFTKFADANQRTIETQNDLWEVRRNPHSTEEQRKAAQHAYDQASAYSLLLAEDALTVN